MRSGIPDQLERGFQMFAISRRIHALGMSLFLVILLTSCIEVSYVTVSFDAKGGLPVASLDVMKGETIAFPETSKEGHALLGWYRSLDDGETYDSKWSFSTMTVEEDLTLYAMWRIEAYDVSFETHGGSIFRPVTLDYGSDLSDYVPIKEGDLFLGWTLDEADDEFITHMPAHDVTLHANWVLGGSMVQVGEPGSVYKVPVGDEVTTASVGGGYLMSATETTYREWYNVRTWAEDHGYVFMNPGKEGSDGSVGGPPSENRHEPVTTISWFDAIVWLNAASEMTGLVPVYRTKDGDISKDMTGTTMDQVMVSNHNGYRLPTFHEWEMAARWQNDSVPGSVVLGGRSWTPGDHASGATSDTNDLVATAEVAWFSENSDTGTGNRTHPVSMLQGNQLGLFDMSGNVWEWVFDSRDDFESGVRVWRGMLRGGSYRDGSGSLRIFFFRIQDAHDVSNGFGFRKVRTL